MRHKYLFSGVIVIVFAAAALLALSKLTSLAAAPGAASNASVQVQPAPVLQTDIYAALNAFATGRSDNMKPASAPGPGPIVLLWDLTKDRFPGLKSTTVQKTTNGVPSIIVELRSAPPDGLQYLAAMTYAAVTNPPHDPTAVCSGANPVLVFNCCKPDVSSDCIRKIIWENAPSTLGKNLAKLTIFLEVLALSGDELGKTSQMFNVQQLQQSQLLGDKLYFVWPYFYKDANGNPIKDTWLFTSMDADTMERLAETAYRVAERVRSIAGLAPNNSNSYICTTTGINPIDITPPGSLQVSSDSPINIRNPPALNQQFFASLTVATEPTAATISLPQIRSPVFGPTNPALNSFLASVPANTEAFPCEGNGFTEALRKGKNLLNNRDGSVWLFYSLYLQGFWQELSPVLLHKPQRVSYRADVDRAESEFDQQTNKIYMVHRPLLTGADIPPYPDCKTLCDQGSYLCMPADDASVNHPAELSNLRKALLKPQPVTITPMDLATIFGMATDPTVGLRKLTSVVHDTLMNVGTPTDIKVVSTANGRLMLEIPGTLSGAFHGDISADELTIKFTSEAQSAVFQIDDPILNGRYGGYVRELYANSHSLIMSMPNGCVEYPLSKSTPSLRHWSRRAKVVAAWLRDRSSAQVLRAMTLGSTDWGSGSNSSCQAVYAPGYGASCPSCPVYEFSCDSGCVDVYGVGAGMRPTAQTYAETLAGTSNCH